MIRDLIHLAPMVLIASVALHLLLLEAAGIAASRLSVDRLPWLLRFLVGDHSFGHLATNALLLAVADLPLVLFLVWRLIASA